MKELEDQKQFVVSTIKRVFLDTQTKTLKIIMKGSEVNHDFELRNRNVYDYITGDFVRAGKQYEYNTEFFLRLRRIYTMQVFDYLSFHYEAENKDTYLKYLKLVILNSDQIQEGKKAAIREWLQEVEKLSKQKEKDMPKTKKVENKDLKLIDLFKDAGEYEKVMQVFIARQLIVSPTNHWISADKKLLPSLIKAMHSLRFYKDGIKQPSNRDTILICKNTFGIEAKPNTVNKTKASDLVNLPIFSKDLTTIAEARKA